MSYMFLQDILDIFITLGELQNSNNLYLYLHKKVLEISMCNKCRESFFGRLVLTTANSVDVAPIFKLFDV